MWKFLQAVLIAVALASALHLSPVDAVAQTQPPAANDQLLLQQMQGNVSGRVSIPDAKSSLLIQPQGRDWQGTQSTVKTFGAIVILGMLAVLCLFFLVRGRIKIDSGPSARRILRFNGIERFTHWLTAVSFVVLALSGLNLVFGRALLLPLFGPEAFTAISQAGKLAHNYLSFPFVLGLLLMIVLWIHHNIPSRIDLEWLKQGGGLLKRGVHPPSAKFNGGQKLIFWSVILGGAAIAVTGYMLMFPFSFAEISGMQTAQVVHAILGLLLIAVIIAHIYIGSIGMEGAFEAMGSGEVDLNWAKEHHSIWVDEVAGKKVSAGDD